MLVSDVSQITENSITSIEGTLEMQTSMGDGSFIDLTILDSPKWYTTGSAGTYTVTPTTDGQGSGVELELVVINTFATYSIDFESSTIINPGSGYSIDDTLIIAGTDLGGTPDNENIEISIIDGSIRNIISSNITTYIDNEAKESAISISAGNTAVIASGILSLLGKTINIEGQLNTPKLTLPSEDPGISGQWWVDTENGNVIKISTGE
jgi:hypothetical protein